MRKGGEDLKKFLSAVVQGSVVRVGVLRWSCAASLFSATPPAHVLQRRATVCSSTARVWVWLLCLSMRAVYTRVKQVIVSWWASFSVRWILV